MRKTIVWQLLRRNISPVQLAGYAVANLLGLAIVLTAIQFYLDVTTAWDSEDSFISRDYVIISKYVDGISLSGKSHEFSPDEIDEIKSQPWAENIGEFTAAEFNVSASLEMWGRGFSTALFLEAIPDEFFDICPDGWEWKIEEGSSRMPELPIIISKDYLTLYNFGFAASRGFPQISESSIGNIPIRISVSGNGRQIYLTGRIVGFSSRLNTVAVPADFMEWANAHFAKQPLGNPSRLIIEVNNPGEPAIQNYLDEKGYESAGDKADSSKMAYFLSIVTAVVIAVGIVISLLAFFILLLSIYLLLQKNREKLRMLMMLGYTPTAVSRHYYAIVGVINASVLLGAILFMLIACSVWSAPLEEIGVGGTTPWITILIGLVIMSAITLGNIVAISRNVRRTFPHPNRK